jgi:hypothetical protein
MRLFFSLKVAAVVFFGPVFTAGLQAALPERAQLRVEVAYTRSVNVKARLGPDNYEKTRMTFSLKGTLATLADVVPPQEPETLPQYQYVLSQTEMIASARLDAEVTIDRGGDDRPVRTVHSYSGSRVNLEDLRLDVRSAYPVSPDAVMADLSFDVEMRGSSTGLPAGLDAESAVCAVRNSPLSNGGDSEPLRSPVKFLLLPVAGPRPAETGPAGALAGRTYDMVYSLSWGGAGLISHGAPSQNWVGAKTSKGFQDLPVVTLDESKTWRDEQGEVTDTLRVSITPERMTLKAVELAAGMDEAAKDRHVGELLREAKKLLGAVKDAEKGREILLKHLAKKLPELSDEDREWIVTDAVAALHDKKVLRYEGDE